MFPLFPLTWLVVAASPFCHDEFREDFATLDAWEARPEWLSARAAAPIAETRDGVARFGIAEANRGMKWQCSLPEVDLEFAPWLVIRYRTAGYAADRADYLLWLGDASPGRDGWQLMAGDRIRTDGQWHVQAIDLTRLGVASPVHSLAVQCFATATGDASLWVDYIALTDNPPEDAEGYEAAGAEGWVREIPVGPSTAWTIEPSWVSNHAERARCEQSGAGLRFAVDEAGRGAKWSRRLPAAIRDAGWVSLCYRAAGLRGGDDYALYVAGEAPGAARAEQYLVRLGDLVPDDAWRVAVAQVEIPAIESLAIQVQTQGESAALEISRIAFHQTRPAIRLADEFRCDEGWPADSGSFRPVTLPPGNLDGPGLARKLKRQGWIPAGRITAEGVPFLIREGTEAVTMTAVKEPGRIAFEPRERAAELYLLLAAQLPLRDEPSYHSSSLQAIRQVERLVARLEYADGTSEAQFPLQLSRHAHQISRGLHVYALAVEPEKPLQRVELVDGMRRGAFALVAATLSDAPGPATQRTALRPALPPPPSRPRVAGRTGIVRSGQRILVESQCLALTLDCERGLRVLSAENRAYAAAPLSIAPGPLFRLVCGKQRLSSADFRVSEIRELATDGGPGLAIDLVWDDAGEPIRVTVMIDIDDPREIGLRAVCDLSGRDTGGAQLFFPELRGVEFGGAAEDHWYWMPRRGDVISNVPISLRAPYAGAGNPFQILGAFSPRAATGLYLMTQDLECVPRFYHLEKTAGQLRLAVEYPLAAGGQTPRAVLGCHSGGWQTQLDRYRQWLATWYRPAAPRKPWFREVFNFRQQFLHFSLPVKSGMFDPQSKTFHFQEVLREDIEAFGGVDYLHLFDWGWDPIHGRCGDYEPWDYLGGEDNLRRAVREVKDLGIPVGLYIEGYLVDRQSKLGQAHGQQWQLLDLQGQPYTFFAPSYHICPWVRPWQDYLSATYARAKRQTGAVGFYIDQFGFSHHYHCTNPAHGHAIPATPVRGECALTQRVREAVGPDCVVYTEESPNDVNSQYQDGSFTYNISSGSDDWSPTRINLYRFIVPDFKTIEIIVCDKPLGSNVEAVKRILFSGEAIWIEGIWDRWFTPETRAYIARMNRVLRDNRRAFSSDWPSPLVPTRAEGVYANMFPERADGRGKTCWTVYNTTFRTLRAELLEVRHFPGAVYRDEFSGQAIPTRLAGETDVLRLDLGPRDVAVISRTVSEAANAAPAR